MVKVNKSNETQVRDTANKNKLFHNNLYLKIPTLKKNYIERVVKGRGHRSPFAW